MNDPRYPIRAKTHQLAERSERYFVSSLPKEWLWEIPRQDYGVDLRVELTEGDRFGGLELLVQLKASTTAKPGDTETVRLKTATYNYLWEKLQVAMLVKYVEEDDEAYWMLFRDIPPPDQGKQSFTIRIPKDNRLSALDWSEIQRIVRYVHMRKLNANRQ